MADGANRGERLQIMLSADELMVLDDFRFKRRMPSRAAAIRELLKRGLAGEGFQAAAFGAKSEEFGVIGRKPDGREKSSGLSLSRLCRTSGTVPGPIHLPQEKLVLVRR